MWACLGGVKTGAARQCKDAQFALVVTERLDSVQACIKPITIAVESHKLFFFFFLLKAVALTAASVRFWSAVPELRQLNLGALASRICWGTNSALVL